jgi:hypothetical protein
MLPAQVSAGLLGLKRTKTPVPSAHLIVKRNGIKAFKSTNVGLNIDVVPYKASDNTQKYLILRGKINDKNSRQNPPPHSTDPLPNAAIAIAKDIQDEALIQYNELYDICLLDRSHRPDLQVNTEVLTRSEAVSLVTPSEEDLSHPITTSTEEVHVNGSIVTPTNHLTLSTVNWCSNRKRICGCTRCSIGGLKLAFSFSQHSVRHQLENLSLGTCSQQRSSQKQMLRPYFFQLRVSPMSHQCMDALLI